MISFESLVHILETQNNALMDSGEDDKMLSVVRSGMALDNGSFWDDFTMLCGDTEGMSQLLGVRPDQVRTWSSRIKSSLDRLKSLDSSPENPPQEKDVMLPTGENGAMTVKRMHAR